MFSRPFVVAACAAVVLAPAVQAAAGSVYSDYVIGQTGPVIYWDMDAFSGNFATDLSPFGSPTALTTGEKTYNAAFTGAGPNPVGGFPAMNPVNVALTLDGLNDTIVNQGTAANTLPNAGVGTGAYSAAVWFNSSVAFNSKRHSYVIGRGETYPSTSTWDSVGVGGSAGYTSKLFYFNGLNATPVILSGTHTLIPNTWYHLLFVRDGNTVQGYLNGVLEFSGTAAWPGGVNPGDKITFGGRADYFGAVPPGQGDMTLAGRVDEAAVWDRALSAQEAAGLYYAALPRYVATVLRDEPAAYWRLNEVAGDNLARDMAPGARHQTLGSGLAPAVTRSGLAPDLGPQRSTLARIGLPLGGFGDVNFAPTIPIGRTGYTDDDYALVVHSGASAVVVPDDQYTVEAWVRPSNTTTYGLVGYLFHRRDFDGTSGFGDSLGMGGTYAGAPAGALFYYNGTTSTWDATPTILVPDQWYHVAFVRDGANIRVYLDGELELTATSAVGGPFDQGTWVFGGRSDMTTLKWPGNIDEVAIYGRALSQNEIVGHFQSAVVPEPSSWLLLTLAGLGLAGWSARRRR